MHAAEAEGGGESIDSGSSDDSTSDSSDSERDSGADADTEGSGDEAGDGNTRPLADPNPMAWHRPGRSAGTEPAVEMMGEVEADYLFKVCAGIRAGLCSIHQKKREAASKAGVAHYDLPCTGQREEFRAAYNKSVEEYGRSKDFTIPKLPGEKHKTSGDMPDVQFVDGIVKRWAGTVATAIGRTAGMKKTTTQAKPTPWYYTNQKLHCVRRRLNECIEKASTNRNTRSQRGKDTTVNEGLDTQAKDEAEDAQLIYEIATIHKQLIKACEDLDKQMREDNERRPRELDFVISFIAPVLTLGLPDLPPRMQGVDKKWIEKMNAVRRKLRKNIRRLERASVKSATEKAQEAMLRDISKGKTGSTAKRGKSFGARTFPTTTKYKGKVLNGPRARRAASAELLFGHCNRWSEGPWRGPLLYGACDTGGREHYAHARSCTDRPGKTCWVGTKDHWVDRSEDERGLPRWTINRSFDNPLRSAKDQLVYDIFTCDMGHRSTDWEPPVAPGEVGVQRWCMGVLTDREWDRLCRVQRNTDGTAKPKIAQPTRAAGPSGFQTKVIRLLPLAHQKLLRVLLDLCLLQCIPPTSLVQSIVSFIPKPGKGMGILDQRPIQLVEMILRELDSIIYARLARGMRLKSLMPTCSYGSHPGRSTAQIIAAVTSAMAAANATASPMIFLCLDLLKAYECTGFFSADLGLEFCKLPERFKAYARAFTHKMKVSLHTRDGYTDPQHPTRSIPQGDSLSCLIYPAVLAPLLHYLQTQTEQHFTVQDDDLQEHIPHSLGPMGYVDDVTAASSRWKRGAKPQWTAIAVFLGAIRGRLNGVKTTAIALNAPADLPTHWEFQAYDIYKHKLVKDVIPFISPDNTVKLLGCHIHPLGGNTVGAEKLKRAMMLAVDNAVRRFPSPQTFRSFYNGSVIPIALYAPIWRRMDAAGIEMVERRARNRMFALMRLQAGNGRSRRPAHVPCKKDGWGLRSLKTEVMAATAREMMVVLSRTDPAADMVQVEMHLLANPHVAQRIRDANLALAAARAAAADAKAALAAARAKAAADVAAILLGDAERVCPFGHPLTKATTLGEDLCGGCAEELVLETAQVMKCEQCGVGNSWWHHYCAGCAVAQTRFLAEWPGGELPTGVEVEWACNKDREREFKRLEAGAQRGAGPPPAVPAAEAAPGPEAGASPAVPMETEPTAAPLAAADAGEAEAAAAKWKEQYVGARACQPPKQLTHWRPAVGALARRGWAGVRTPVAPPARVAGSHPRTASATTAHDNLWDTISAHRSTINDWAGKTFAELAADNSPDAERVRTALTDLGPDGGSRPYLRGALPPVGVAHLRPLIRTSTVTKWTIDATDIARFAPIPEIPQGQARFDQVAQKFWMTDNIINVYAAILNTACAPASRGVEAGAAYNCANPTVVLGNGTAQHITLGNFKAATIEAGKECARADGTPDGWRFANATRWIFLTLVHNHWRQVVVDRRSRRVMVYDNLAGNVRELATAVLAFAKEIPIPNAPPSEHEWEIWDMGTAATQQVAYLCGLHTMADATDIVKGLPLGTTMPGHRVRSKNARTAANDFKERALQALINGDMIKQVQGRPRTQADLARSPQRRMPPRLPMPTAPASRGSRETRGARVRTRANPPPAHAPSALAEAISFLAGGDLYVRDRAAEPVARACDELAISMFHPKAVAMQRQYAAAVALVHGEDKARKRADARLRAKLHAAIRRGGGTRAEQMPADLRDAYAAHVALRDAGDQPASLALWIRRVRRQARLRRKRNARPRFEFDSEQWLRGGAGRAPAAAPKPAPPAITLAQSTLTAQIGGAGLTNMRKVSLALARLPTSPYTALLKRMIVQAASEFRSEVQVYSRFCDGELPADACTHKAIANPQAWRGPDPRALLLDTAMLVSGTGRGEPDKRQDLAMDGSAQYAGGGRETTDDNTQRNAPSAEPAQEETAQTNAAGFAIVIEQRECRRPQTKEAETSPPADAIELRELQSTKSADPDAWTFPAPEFYGARAMDSGTAEVAAAVVTEAGSHPRAETLAYSDYMPVITRMQTGLPLPLNPARTLARCARAPQVSRLNAIRKFREDIGATPIWWIHSPAHQDEKARKRFEARQQAAGPDSPLAADDNGEDYEPVPNAMVESMNIQADLRAKEAGEAAAGRPPDCAYPLGGTRFVLSAPIAIRSDKGVQPTHTRAMITDSAAPLIRAIRTRQAMDKWAQHCPSQGARIRHDSEIQGRFDTGERGRAAHRHYYNIWKTLTRNNFTHIAAMRADEETLAWGMLHQPAMLKACPLCNMAEADQRHSLWCHNCSAANRPKRRYAPEGTEEPGEEAVPRPGPLDDTAKEFNRMRHEQWLAPREAALQRMLDVNTIDKEVKKLQEASDPHFTKTNTHYRTDSYPVTSALRLLPSHSKRAPRPPLDLMRPNRPYEGAHQTVCTFCHLEQPMQRQLQRCSTCQYARHRACGKAEQREGDHWRCRWCDEEESARAASSAHWLRLARQGALSQEAVRGATAGPWDLAARGHIPRALWEMGKRQERGRKRGQASMREHGVDQDDSYMSILELSDAMMAAELTRRPERPPDDEDLEKQAIENMNSIGRQDWEQTHLDEAGNSPSELDELIQAMEKERPPDDEDLEAQAEEELEDIGRQEWAQAHLDASGNAPPALDEQIEAMDVERTAEEGKEDDADADEGKESSSNGDGATAATARRQRQERRQRWNS